MELGAKGDRFPSNLEDLPVSCKQPCLAHSPSGLARLPDSGSESKPDLFRAERQLRERAGDDTAGEARVAESSDEHDKT